MRYFVPDIRIASEVRSDPDFQEKLGGLPWGLAPASWPKCRRCGKSQSLLAQFRHHAIRLDLGREGRILFAFQCNHFPGLCPTWDGSAGANACFVVEPEDLTNRVAPMPNDQPTIEHEVCITGWVERDDGLPESLVPAFFTEDHDTPGYADAWNSVTWSTRLGSVPQWLQKPDAESVSGGWRFVGQLDSTYSFLVPPNVPATCVSVDEERWEGRTHLAHGPNFGFGIAYLFLRTRDGVPEGRILWQR